MLRFNAGCHISVVLQFANPEVPELIHVPRDWKWVRWFTALWCWVLCPIYQEAGCPPIYWFRGPGWQRWHCSALSGKGESGAPALGATLNGWVQISAASDSDDGNIMAECNFKSKPLDVVFGQHSKISKVSIDRGNHFWGPSISGPVVGQFALVTSWMVLSSL